MIFLNHIPSPVERNQSEAQLPFDLRSFHRGVAQLASASALGAEGLPRTTHPSNQFSAPWCNWIAPLRSNQGVSVRLRTGPQTNLRFSSNSGRQYRNSEASRRCLVTFPSLIAPIPIRAFGCRGFIFSTANEQTLASANSCSEGKWGSRNSLNQGSLVGVSKAPRSRSSRVGRRKQTLAGAQSRYRNPFTQKYNANNTMLSNSEKSPHGTTSFACLSMKHM